MLIRPATEADSHKVFEWRNDPLTRAMSVTTGEVTWDDHCAWYGKALLSPDRVLYLGKLPSGDDVGMCRFDIAQDTGTAEVSINLAPAMRGRHLSSQLLRAAIDVFWKTYPLRLTARIKKLNVASVRCFETVGFSRDDENDEFSFFTLSRTT